MAVSWRTAIVPSVLTTSLCVLCSTATVSMAMMIIQARLVDGVLRCRSPRLHRSDVETVWKMSPRPGDWKSAAKSDLHIHLSVVDETGVSHASQFGVQLWLMPVQ